MNAQTQVDLTISNHSSGLVSSKPFVFGDVLQSGRETLLGKSDGFDESFGHTGECRRTLPADSKRKAVWKMLRKPGRSPWDVARKKRIGFLERLWMIPSWSKNAEVVGRQLRVSQKDIEGPKDSNVLQNHDL